MRKTLVLLVVLVMFGVNLYSEYLNVGSDVNKISTSKIKSIKIDWRFETLKWSPDGEYFMLSDKENNLYDPEIRIYKKNGDLFRTYNGIFKFWDPKSQFIIALSKNETNPKDRNVCKFDIINNIKKVFDLLIEKNNIDLIDIKKINNNIFLYSSFYKVFEFDMIIEKSHFLFYKNIYSPDAFLFNDCLYYIENFDGNIEDLFKYDLKTKKSKKIIPYGMYLVSYNITKSNKLIFILEKGNGIIFFDINGKQLYKQKDYLGIPIQEETPEFLNTDFSSLSPNGKIFAITNGRFTEVVDEFISGDIYLIGLNGMKKKITNTDNEIELVKGWSPQGDKLIYYSWNKKEYVILQISRTQ